MCEKHLHCYVYKFAGRSDAGHDTMKSIEILVAGMVGRRWLHKELIS